MNNPNKNQTTETLRRLDMESYERFRINLYSLAEKMLAEFEMGWDDLAAMLATYVGAGTFVKEDKETGMYRMITGDELRAELGGGDLTLAELNQIANCFSQDIHIIFKPRYPYTNS